MSIRYIAAFEIASSKIKGAVATVDSDSGRLSVLAVEEERATDLVHYGCVRKPAEVFSHVESVRKKLEAHPAVAPRKIEKAVVSLGGHTLMSTVKSTEMTFPEDTVITDDIIRELKRRIGEQGVENREVVKVLPRDYTVNGFSQQSPLGMFCRSISANLNVVYCSNQLKINLNRVFETQSVNSANIQVLKYPVRPLAIANIVLSNEDKQLGCMLVDFGAETTTVSIYKGSTLRYLVTLPFGSRNITRDIMNIRSCLENVAENLKCTLGNIDPEQKSANPDTKEINNFIEARASEIIANINEQLNYAGIKPEELPRGIIITGGGAKLPGFNTLLSQQTDLKIRTAVPDYKINICDGSLRPSDEVDVIALLAHAASLRDKTDMLSMPKIEKPVTDDNVSRIGEENDEPLDEGEEKPKPASKPKSMSILDKLKNLLSDNDNDDN